MPVRDANVGMVAVMGLTTVEIIKLWQSVAPTLEEMRSSAPNDDAMRQRLMDADHLGAGLALLVGGATGILLKSWLPLLMALGSVVMFSRWHHMVLASSNEGMT